MKRKPIATLSVALASLAFMHLASASAITFIYTCTTTGDGNGTQTCTVGDPLVEVEIATTSENGILRVSARATNQLIALWDTKKDYNVTSLLLNLADATYGSNGLGDSGLPWYVKNSSTAYSTLEFLYTGGNDAVPSDWSGAAAIKVEDNYSTTSPWAGFDLELDKQHANLNFPVLQSVAWDTMGFMRSGNAFDLLPEMFLLTTENIAAPQHPDTIFTAAGADCLGSHQGLLSTVHFEPSNVGLNGCTGHKNYGPWLGAFAKTSPDIPVPEPATLALLGLGLAGLGFSRRKQ